YPGAQAGAFLAILGAAIDHRDGSIVTVGDFAKTENVGVSITSNAGSGDIFAARYRPNDFGCLWAKPFGSSTDHHAGGGAVDANGNVVVVGQISAATIFAGATLTPAGGTDAVWLEYDAAGNEVAGRLFGGPGNDAFSSVTARAGAFVAGGSFQGQVGLG